MSRSHHVLSLSIASLALLSLSTPSFASFGTGSQSQHPPVADIQFDSSIPDDQYNLMAQDLEDLQKFEFTRPDSKLLSVMGLRDSSPRSMLNWLKDRVHYIVGEKFKPARQVRSETKNQAFPFDHESSDVDFNILDLFSSKPVVVMSNVGGGLYALSKDAHTIYSFAIPGLDDVTLTSPRTGIIQIGKGLFNKNIAGLGDEPAQSKVRFAFRMGTFFHEARHSDGHGKSLTFPHAICPAGHEYEGSPACDANLNGPYTVGAHFFNSLARSCRDCSSHDLEMIRIQALDSFSRVLPATVSQGATDPSGKAANRLRTLTRAVYFCEAFHEVGLSSSDISETCSGIPQYKTEISTIKSEHPDFIIQNSTNWDPIPESVQ